VVPNHAFFELEIMNLKGRNFTVDYSPWVSDLISDASEDRFYLYGQ
jgi:hypothetical protein